MLKVILVFLLMLSTLLAKSYNFTELRYSDATGHYTQLEGKINFNENGLEIAYPKNKILLTYEDDDLIYRHDNKILALDSGQENNMKRYFDILRLLHAGDRDELVDMFKIRELSDKTVLKPLGTIKYYIDKIELKKEQKKLHYVKLFLKNSDSISITINDEI